MSRCRRITTTWATRRRGCTCASGNAPSAADGLALAGLPAGEHEQEIAQPIEVDAHRRIRRTMGVFQRDDRALGAPHDRAREVERRAGGVRAGDDEDLGERLL